MSMMDKQEIEEFKKSLSGFRDEVLEEAALEAEKAMDKMLIGKMRIGALMAARAIRALKR